MYGNRMSVVTEIAIINNIKIDLQYHLLQEIRNYGIYVHEFMINVFVDKELYVINNACMIPRENIVDWVLHMYYHDEHAYKC